MDCIFCQIVEGKIPSYKVYEDDFVYAFLDISQGTKGHTLVIPKKHVATVYDLSEEEASQVFKVVPKLSKALKKAFNPIGLNLVSNNEQPYQTVHHFHIHLLPRYVDDEFTLSIINHYDDLAQSDFVSIQDTIKTALKD